MEEVEEAEEVAFIDDFYLTSGSKHPSLMEVPFAIQKIPWEKSELGKIYVQGNCNGAYKVSVEIDMWRLELPLEGKPKFLVRQVTGAWMALRRPRDFYLETMKVVSVAAYFLIFAKRSPNSSKGDVWRYLRKECSEYKVKPNQRDLIQSFLLCRSVVTSDPKLQQSPILSQFFPTLSMKRGAQVAQVADDSRRRLFVKEERSAVPEVSTSEGHCSCKETHSVVPPVFEILRESSLQSAQKTHRPADCEASPLAADVLRGETSLQSAPRTHSLAKFEASPSVADISKGGPSLESAQRTYRSAECEASPIAADILRGVTSLQSTPKTHSLAEFEASPPVVDISKGVTSLQSAPKTHSLALFEATPPVVDISKRESSLQFAQNTHGPADCEASTIIADFLADVPKQESSLQPTPRTRSLSEFGTEVELRVSKRPISDSKKRKPGRPARRISRKRKKGNDKSSVVGDGDWIDEPDVCAFCDDGVEKGDELLWVTLQVGGDGAVLNL